MDSLQGKIAIVTGAASGMGDAIAKLFINRGANVVLADVNTDYLDQICSEVKCTSNNILSVTTDVSKQKDLENLMTQTLEKFGSVDIVINNAGIMDNFTTLGNLEMSYWQKVMDINVKGPTILSKLAIQYWLEEKKPGVVINIASVGGLFGARGGVSYVTSKHAIIGLTRNIASVYREDNIRAVAIAPGSIETNIGASINHPDMKGMEALNREVSQGPTGQPLDIAQAAAFLASDEAKFVNGTVLTVDGGWTGA